MAETKAAKAARVATERATAAATKLADVLARRGGKTVSVTREKLDKMLEFRGGYFGLIKRQADQHCQLLSLLLRVPELMSDWFVDQMRAAEVLGGAPAPVHLTAGEIRKFIESCNGVYGFGVWLTGKETDTLPDYFVTLGVRYPDVDAEVEAPTMTLAQKNAARLKAMQDRIADRAENEARVARHTGVAS